MVKQSRKYRGYNIRLVDMAEDDEKPAWSWDIDWIDKNGKTHIESGEEECSKITEALKFAKEDVDSLIKKSKEKN
jgi:hypothetical protein